MAAVGWQCANPSPRASGPPEEPGGPADQSGTSGAAAQVDERPEEEHALPSRGRSLGTRAGPAGDARGDERPTPKAAAPGEGTGPRAPSRPPAGGRRLGAPDEEGDGPAAGATADCDGVGKTSPGASDGNRDDGDGGDAPATPPEGRRDAGDTGDTDGVGLVATASDDDRADEDDAAPTGRGAGVRLSSPAAGVAGEEGGHSSPSLVGAPPACRGVALSWAKATGSGGGGAGRTVAWRAIFRRLHSAETAKRVPSDALRRSPRPVGMGSRSAGATSGGSVIATVHKKWGCGRGREGRQAGTVAR